MCAERASAEQKPLTSHGTTTSAFAATTDSMLETDVVAPPLPSGLIDPTQVVALQRIVGNQAVQRLLAGQKASALATIRRSAGRDVIQREGGGGGGGMGPAEKAEMLKSTGDTNAAESSETSPSSASTAPVVGSYGTNPYGLNTDTVASIATAMGVTPAEMPAETPASSPDSSPTPDSTPTSAASALSTLTSGTPTASGSYGTNPYGMNSASVESIATAMGIVPTATSPSSPTSVPTSTSTSTSTPTSASGSETAAYGSGGYGMTDAAIASITAAIGGTLTASTAATAVPTSASASPTASAAPASGGGLRASYPAGSTGVGSYHSKARLTGDWENTKGKSLGGDAAKFSWPAIPLLAEYHGDVEKDAVADARGLKPVKWKEAGGRKVKYISDEAERASYELKLHVDNKFYWRGQVMDTTRFVRATGAGLNRTTAASVIFVLTVDGKVYLADEGTEYRLGTEETTADQWRFNHSSLVGGAPIASAGEMRFKNGVLTAISNKSGHYHPGLDSIVRVLKHFAEHGVNVDDVMVEAQGSAATQTASALLSGASGPVTPVPKAPPGSAYDPASIKPSSAASSTPTPPTPTPAPAPTPTPTPESSASPAPETSAYSAYALNPDVATSTASSTPTTTSDTTSDTTSAPETSAYSAYAFNPDVATSTGSPTPTTTPETSASPSGSLPETSVAPTSESPRGLGVPVKKLIQFWEKFQRA